MLCCAFQDPIHVWSGCLEGKLKSFDINSNQEAVIGQHDNAIRCIEYSNDVNAVCSIFIFYHVMQGFFKDNPTSSSKCLGIHKIRALAGNLKLGGLEIFFQRVTGGDFLKITVYKKWYGNF